MSKSFFAGVSLVVGLLGSTAGAATGRLPVGVTPVAYDIVVDPDATKLVFTGSETVTIDVAQPTRTLTLNAADLAVATATLDGRAASKIVVDGVSQRLVLTFAAPIAKGRHALAMTYSGKIYESASGMFVIDYTNTDGSKDRMLMTQFEAPDARRFAPMWDEPGYKATFTLTAAAPGGQTAFSNMPVVGKTGGPAGKTLWKFATTPKMSSYLLMLGIGNVERKTVMAGKTEIGVITRKGVVDQGDYALASAKRILAYYNDYFGTPYPLPKLDMIAGPGSSQFFSAMENWGAILYFERVLLIDPKLTTEGQKQDVHNVVAHEMAHQWFGDLVTMSWWEDLWLNEGFASWMASKVSADLNPSWNSLTQSLAFERQAAMGLDARSTTHPIIQKIETVDQISQAFDSITYLKGEAVIRMLEGAVGADAFRQGVRTYMTKYKYGNTVTDQLWTEIGTASGQPVSPMMHGFTLQGGVPLIKVGEPVCNAGTTSVPLSQERFALDAESRAPRNWLVPVRVATAGGSPTEPITVTGASPVAAKLAGCGPVVVNAGQSAYFRTLYTPAHYEALREAFGSLSLDDRVGFVADSLALANGGYQPIERYLSLVDTVPADASPVLWSLVASQLRAIDRVLEDAPGQMAFRARGRTILSPVFARLGWTAKAGEEPAAAQLRDDLLPVLGSLFTDQAVADEAARYAMQSFDSPDSVPGSIRQPALVIFARNADAARWEMLHQKAKAETNPVLRQTLYRNLGLVNDRLLAQRALDLALTDEAPVPTRAEIISAVASVHSAMAFDWAVAHAERVNALLESSTRSAFIVQLAGGSSDPAVASRVTGYAAKALPIGSRKPAEQVASVIRYRAGLRQMQTAALAKWSAR